MEHGPDVLHSFWRCLRLVVSRYFRGGYLFGRNESVEAVAGVTLEALPRREGERSKSQARLEGTKSGIIHHHQTLFFKIENLFLDVNVPKHLEIRLS